MSSSGVTFTCQSHDKLNPLSHSSHNRLETNKSRSLKPHLTIETNFSRAIIDRPSILNAQETFTKKRSEALISMYKEPAFDPSCLISKPLFEAQLSLGYRNSPSLTTLAQTGANQASESSPTYHCSIRPTYNQPRLAKRMPIVPNIRLDEVCQKNNSGGKVKGNCLKNSREEILQKGSKSSRSGRVLPASSKKSVVSNTAREKEKNESSFHKVGSSQHKREKSKEKEKSRANECGLFSRKGTNMSSKQLLSNISMKQLRPSGSKDKIRLGILAGKISPKTKSPTAFKNKISKANSTDRKHMKTHSLNGSADKQTKGTVIDTLRSLFGRQRACSQTEKNDITLKKEFLRLRRDNPLQSTDAEVYFLKKPFEHHYHHQNSVHSNLNMHSSRPSSHKNVKKKSLVNNALDIRKLTFRELHNKTNRSDIKNMFIGESAYTQKNLSPQAPNSSFRHFIESQHLYPHPSTSFSRRMHYLGNMDTDRNNRHWIRPGKNKEVCGGGLSRSRSKNSAKKEGRACLIMSGNISKSKFINDSDRRASKMITER